ncbi:Bcr/CflA family drug resistance efflux transporter [Arthrobacter sp. MYb211]|uniref:multidrug effflux MFS transporter n=1 Tax=Micrococcaceae TaxID=1268 RepID=UPI000CFB11A6|nr:MULTISPECIES: multidrug effflux MFS transporter [unclassified Arthrobacter]PQZ98625.1 Bcr/CflA family drug resistance efflux transporter [Arthrobacter sp. MYb224]PRA02959.1 Bcr/CflA family drug resistance efflux transporter [Arthrobacter sp. MYb229]PRA11079.1 Bcr/CflA family drug resistance efflux transporter [Arthrobacter sp. MYb221]PRB49429.1 Bcr/CflA family drug resistance efflux transporter [Arthrobacter sp. MYb216]PRC07233.1 Bcr/CflA family drug resistance efflux transporter [Arthrobac
MPSAFERSRLTPPLFALLILLGTTGPLATDMYLPSFPAMTQEFSTSASAIQLTLTFFLLGMGLGQLLWGALSDRLGRARPLRWGTALFVLASVAAALAPSLEALSIARGLQGIGGAAGVVISKAIVADTTKGVQTARTFSILMTFGAIAPAVAPLLGAYLGELGGFRLVLWVLSAAALLMVTGSLAIYRETLAPAARSGGNFLAPLKLALSRRRFVGYLVQFGFAFGAMMAYVSASPFLYQEVLGLSARGYALCFGLNAAGLILSGLVSARLVGRVPLRRTISVALTILLGASLVILLLAMLQIRSLGLAAVIFVLVSSIGFTMGNTTGLALAEVRDVSGSGSALLGSAQFLIGALATPLVGLSGADSALAFALTAVASSLIAFGALLYTADRFHPGAMEHP